MRGAAVCGWGGGEEGGRRWLVEKRGLEPPNRPAKSDSLNSTLRNSIDSTPIHGLGGVDGDYGDGDEGTNAEGVLKARVLRRLSQRASRRRAACRGARASAHP